MRRGASKRGASPIAAGIFVHFGASGMMSSMLRIVVWGLLALLGSRQAAWARWEGPADNKSEAQLSQMSLNDLFNEGFDVCVRRATLLAGVRAGEPPDPASGAAGDYLSLIEGYARDKNGGRLPEWMRALSFARTTRECQTVFRSFVGGEMAPETRPAQVQPAPKSHPRPTVAARPAVRRPPPTEPEEIEEELVEPTPIPTEKTEPTATRPRPTPVPTRTKVPTRPRPSVTPRPTHTERPVYEHLPPSPRPARPEITDELPPWLRPPKR